MKTNRVLAKVYLIQINIGHIVLVVEQCYSGSVVSEIDYRLKVTFIGSLPRIEFRTGDGAELVISPMKAVGCDETGFSRVDKLAVDNRIDS